MIDAIKQKFPNIVLDAREQTLTIKKEGIRALASALKDDGFNLLIDLFAVDYLHWEEKAVRFEMVYNLYSLSKNQRLFIKAQVSDPGPEIDSVTSIWPAANWYEREVWDMMGIVFKGHPNLKRLLMYEEFKGHPLRKDYVYNHRQPLIGPMR